MPRYKVEYYFAETQTETIEANSEEEAKQSVLDDLNYQHDLLHRPCDITFGVLYVEEQEGEEK